MEKKLKKKFQQVCSEQLGESLPRFKFPFPHWVRYENFGICGNKARTCHIMIPKQFQCPFNKFFKVPKNIFFYGRFLSELLREGPGEGLLKFTSLEGAKCGEVPDLKYGT